MLNPVLFSSAEFSKAFPGVVLNHQAWPKRRIDRQILLVSVAAFFDFNKDHYREIDVNDLIMTWIALFGENLRLDHVTLRRELIDARILVRRSDGSAYCTVADEVLAENIAMVRSVDLEALVTEEKNRRQQSRRRYLNSVAASGAGG